MNRENEKNHSRRITIKHTHDPYIAGAEMLSLFLICGLLLVREQAPGMTICFLSSCRVVGITPSRDM